MAENEYLKMLNSAYATSQKYYAIQMYDLYTNSHKIKFKKDKEIDNRVFQTTKVLLNLYKVTVKFIIDFVLQRPVKVSHPDEDFQNFILNFEKNNRIISYNRKLLENLCVFGQTYEHFYLDEDGEPRLRNIMGMAAIPFFDDYMELEAFIEDYKVLDENNQEKRIVRLFTNEEIEEYKNNLILEASEENIFSQIPIISYIQEFHGKVISDLEDIQSLIEEYEEKLSDIGDTIEYHSDPTLVAFGQKLPNLDARKGKILNFEKGADVRYLTWNQDVEAVKWYLKELKDLIFEISMTPKVILSPTSISNISGVALSIMYSTALIKANEKQLVLKHGFTERYKLLAELYKIKTGRDINLDELEITFNVSIPANEAELVNNLLMLYNSGVISRETVMNNVPYVTDVAQETERIKEETYDVYEEQAQEELKNIQEENE